MNRRAFFKKLGTSILGGFLLYKIPFVESSTVQEVNPMQFRISYYLGTSLKYATIYVDTSVKYPDFFPVGALLANLKAQGAKAFTITIPLI